MIEIDGPRALELLESIVAERPDYVYQKPSSGWCSYVEYNDGQPVAPGCGVGVALHKAGLSLEKLDTLDDVVGAISAYEGELPELWLTPEARDVFAVFQYAQDNGVTWQESLNRAKAYFDIATV
jgi:hypothetical protein